MLKRLWFLVSVCWALCELAGWFTGREELSEKILLIAFFPFVAGYVVSRSLCYVKTGSIREPHEPRIIFTTRVP